MSLEHLSVQERQRQATLLPHLFWFQGSLPRQVAEKLLQKSNSDGSFVIRESSNIAGCYVVSLTNDGTVQHFQIIRRSPGHFSIDDGPVFFGVDALIKHYEQKNDGLPVKLTKFIPGFLPPWDLVGRGYNTMISEHFEKGNIDLAIQLISSGWWRDYLDIRNPHGYTLLHEASYRGVGTVVKELLLAGADITVRDITGATPLQRACSGDRANICDILLNYGANPQEQCSSTGWVALHEAAVRGHVECARSLLQHDAPGYPQSLDGDTPADLALRYGHMPVYDLIMSHTGPKPKLQKMHWFHPDINNRKGAIVLLKKSGLKDGSFLIRNTKHDPTGFVVSMAHATNIFHFEIKQKDQQWFSIESGPLFETLETLVAHYQRLADGLPTTLQHPIPPSFIQPLPGMSTRTKTTSPRVPSTFGPAPLPRVPGLSSAPVQVTSSPPMWTSSPLSTTPTTPLSQTGMARFRPPSPPIPVQPRLPDTSKPFHTQRSLPDAPSPRLGIRVPDSNPSPPPTHRPSPNLKHTPSMPRQPAPPPPSSSNSHRPHPQGCETFGHGVGQMLIGTSCISLGSEVGQGEYGSVLMGKYTNPDTGVMRDVALKTVRADKIQHGEKEFLREARVMMGLEHSCIVLFVGICLGPPLMLVQELMPGGCLLDLLLDFPQEVDETSLKRWAAQIAEGMMYLEEKRFVHRDLAARNILLASRKQVKISDFGLSRAIGADHDYYKASTGGRWPVKWYAPESIIYGHFSHASDVWSYGITLWEMFTLGQQPYGELGGAQVVELLEDSKRLPCPDHCPQGVYDIMMKCWSWKCDDRPTFRDLNSTFCTDPDYMCIHETVYSYKRI